MNPRSCLSALMLGLFCAALIYGCGNRTDDASQERLPDSFHFMDIGVNTVVDRAVLSKLNQALGAEAVDRHTPISLEIKYKGFLKAYDPELAALDQQLNPNDIQRREYPATRLTFRYTQQKESLFDYVELIHLNASGFPLVIKMITKKEIPDLIQNLQEKFGPPQVVTLTDGTGMTWRQNQDAFMITRIIGPLGNPENHLMIVFTSRLRQLLLHESAKAGRRQGAQPTDNFFR